MMGSREILTLQFGQYSNFIGTHWWNIQEAGFTYNSTEISEIDHDCLFREGLTNRREVTFTPRLLCVDLRDGLKALPETGELYENLEVPSSSQLNWDDSVEVKEQDPDEKTEFVKDLADNPEEVLNKDYNLDSDVKVWSDFLYSRFHPRTLNVVKQYQYGNVNTPFDVFPVGTTIWKTNQFEDDFCDKIRNYVEECDSFQGFHMLSDCFNSFSGLSSSCIEYIRDEYERKSVLVFPVIPSHFIDDDVNQQSIRVINTALSFESLAEHSSLFVPLCTGEQGWREPGPPRSFYHTNYNHELLYHSSAILASALDTITLKHRLKSNSFSLIDLCTDLNQSGRKCASASLCLPFSINKDTEFIECLDKWQGPLSKSITPNCELGTERLMQHITIRGIPENRLKKPPNQAGNQKSYPAYDKCNTIEEMLTFYYSCTLYATATNVTAVQRPLTVKTPFPRIFDKVLDNQGNVTNTEHLQSPESVPVLAGLHSDGKIGEMLETLHTNARKIRFKRFNSFTVGGIDNDDFEECLNKLFDLREQYEDNYYL